MDTKVFGHLHAAALAQVGHLVDLGGPMACTAPIRLSMARTDLRNAVVRLSPRGEVEVQLDIVLADFLMVFNHLVLAFGQPHKAGAEPGPLINRTVRDFFCGAPLPADHLQSREAAQATPASVIACWELFWILAHEIAHVALGHVTEESLARLERLTQRKAEGEDNPLTDWIHLPEEEAAADELASKALLRQLGGRRFEALLCFQMLFQFLNLVNVPYILLVSRVSPLDDFFIRNMKDERLARDTLGRGGFLSHPDPISRLGTVMDAVGARSMDFILRGSQEAKALLDFNAELLRLQLAMRYLTDLANWEERDALARRYARGSSDPTQLEALLTAEVRRIVADFVLPYIPTLTSELAESGFA